MLNDSTGTFDISNFTTNQNNAAGVLIDGPDHPRRTVDFAGDSGSVTLQTNGAPALRAIGPNLSMGTSTFDDIVVTNSNDGGVDMDTTTGTTILGDGSGTDLNLTTTSGAEPALDLNNAGLVIVGFNGTDEVHATGGPAVDITATSGSSFSFDDVDSTNSSTDGINLDGLGAASFEGLGGDIAGADQISFDLNGGNVFDLLQRQLRQRRRHHRHRHHRSQRRRRHAQRPDLRHERPRRHDQRDGEYRRLDDVHQRDEAGRHTARGHGTATVSSSRATAATR